MELKQALTIILFLIGELCCANMASPIKAGTYSSSAFSSRDIDIIKEEINLQIAKDFKTAAYVIEYFIKTDTAGKQIPLLFYALDYQGDFNVWVDNQEVTLLQIPSEYTTTSNTPFSKFSNSVDSSVRQGESETVAISWGKNSRLVYELRDLKYFELDLSKGEHTIRVEYTANVWTDISNWVKQFSFRYSLSPAKNWKSFGSLQILLNVSAYNSSVTTNLGSPNSGKLDSIAVWNFTKIPSEYFEIVSTPPISKFAKIMIAIGPTGITLIIALLFMSFHVIAIKEYRKREPIKGYSWVVIVGSVTIPFLILISFMFSFTLIDSAIGEAAGKYHGYPFLAVVLYPLVLPVYWLIMWWIDKKIKRTMSHIL